MTESPEVTCFSMCINVGQLPRERGEGTLSACSDPLTPREVPVTNSDGMRVDAWQCLCGAVMPPPHCAEQEVKDRIYTEFPHLPILSDESCSGDMTGEAPPLDPGEPLASEGPDALGSDPETKGPEQG